jgi:hypothetical protein
MTESVVQSSWEWTRSQSQYHFDTQKIDGRWDTALVIGQFEPCWHTELAEIISQSRPATWATRGYKGEGAEAPSAELATEEYDLDRIGLNRDHVISNLNWRIPPVLHRITELFAMEDSMERIHVQLPGQTFNLHMDKLQKWCPEDPNRVLRLFVQLTDWQPGQFWEYGNYHHNRWRAGEVHTFDWRNVPHSTANAGHHPRVTFQITGVITSKTEQFLTQLKHTSIYKII